ncbi:MAG: hypothetical protein DMF58_20735 [Acidobacteria bacterium]|nr:MAG: hypothetical protein DMF58_20735 [Acidobacteriota bacterium]
MVTSPDGAIFRIDPLSSSATYTLPAESTARPSGLSNRAAERNPSAVPRRPVEPASVITLPEAEIMRIVSLSVSAT